MARRTRRKLGEFLLTAGLITRAQLEDGLEEQKKLGEKLGQVLVRLGYITENDIITIMEEQLRVPRVEMDNFMADQMVIGLIPEGVARSQQVIPLYVDEGVLHVAMTDPLDIFAIDEVARTTCKEVEPHICTVAEMERALNQYYGESHSLADIIESLPEESIEGDESEVEISRLQTIAQEAPVVKLVNNIIAQALRDSASDIHFEPEENLTRIRYRIDGILYEIHNTPKRLQLPIISRIKIMSRMDIANRRTPQDGRFDIKKENREIAIRVSTFPTVYGENVVMRLLDKSTALYRMDRLGLQKDDLERFEKLIHKPYGMILAAGPTGSGKTTTLYAILNRVNSVEKNIKTIEDPVEYRLNWVRQSQVNPRAGLTFATGLRAILRQDPDIIMVGEIRDQETAEIAVQAALTGHLVFSTVHTNDAAGALVRLADMGTEPFLISSSVIGIISQRLLRTICPECREAYTPSPAYLQNLGLGDGHNIPTLYRGRGCSFCKNSGYRGRTGIFETLVVSDELREKIVERSSSAVIAAIAQQQGMRTLRQDAIQKALSGITTPEEAIRVTMTD
ncbi:MAG: Flp pilus assembly complex ATPase component TadA [Deltaproteobacteria bacterium]|nr:Flp pilus assembly complex ATPase component TadA [Deltaproteobacteria bacterium]MBW2308386.1 Flp pilus assembly complex ATPase component TadA [Deltaproteobacteria bacterium]